MHVVAIVQARLSSRRLPGKVLLPLGGRPLLSYLFESLAACHMLDGMVLATSTDPSDDPLATFASDHGVACFRGALEDVAGRMSDAARRSGADVFVRVNADSPLLDPTLVDRGVELFRGEPVDLVTNVWPRTFPRGQGVEVIAASALARALENMTSEAEREHVTRHFYVNPERYTIRAFVAARPRPEVQLSVDDAGDLARCEEILRALGRPPCAAGWEACVAASDALSDHESGVPAPGVR